MIRDTHKNLNCKRSSREVSSLRVILAAGGSGGHIFPCVSLASELEKAGVKDVFIVSSRRKLDMNLLGEVKYERFFLSINPMPRKFSFKSIAVFVFNCVKDLAASVWIIATKRPKVVVGFGGYSSGAISLAAKIMFVPLVIHEQNAVPGRANVILSPIADRIALSFESSRKCFGRYTGKTVFTGNPIRLEILRNDRVRSASLLGISPEKETILIMGGSQGAGFLNRIMLETALEIKNKKGREVQFVHITGQGPDKEKVERFYEQHAIPGKVFGFMENIGDAYSVSDMVVSRSGAAAIFEIAYYGKPMILVPYPNPKNNQADNARSFSSAEAALYREEKSLSSEGLCREILGILDNAEKRSL
ncbi:MAG TPA: undecaprenyldiphospho-muramoylpentapeptide beta-N-acetylglucosaminyltransferase, partial [Candidatus Omnitrophota bacterium]|nr:undecaprenyldiphospho-muramoylpentapeptide beta-N-acetylglucosaminyltransferase [Candidatus Omnitrophota bacterium]